MRQRPGAKLDFVTLTEGSDSTDVLIDTTGQTIGQYTLILESFNTLSAV